MGGEPPSAPTRPLAAPLSSMESDPPVKRLEVTQPHSVVLSLSRVQLFVTLWTAARQASLSFTISQSLLKLMSVESVMPSNHLILCRPLLLLPSIFPSIRVFSNESVLHIRWPKYWSFSFSISPSKEYSGLISFRNAWFDLLAAQETLKSLLQHHSLKASILWHSAFFMVQLTSIHDYWKNDSFDYTDLCRQTDVSDFNTLSRLVIAFLPRNKHYSVFLRNNGYPLEDVLIISASPVQVHDSSNFLSKATPKDIVS